MILLASVSLAGCGGGLGTSRTGDAAVSLSAASQQATISGIVGGAQPLGGLALKLRTDSGLELATTTTTLGGYFRLTVAPSLEPVVVLVTRDENTHYAARLDRLPVGSTWVTINAASTLAEASARLTPQTSQTVVDEQVRTYLGLPTGAPLATVASNRAYGFDERRFLAAASAHGSFDGFVQLHAQALSKRASASQAATAAPSTPFASSLSPAETGFSLGSAATSLLSGLGASLKSYAGSAAVTWVMAELGLPTRTEAQLNRIEELLTDIRNQLVTIENTLNNLVIAVQDSLTTQLKTQLTTTLSYIDTTTSQVSADFSRAAENPLNVDDATIRALGNDILTAHKTMVLDIGQIQLGVSGGIGLIAPTVAKYGDAGRFINSDNLQAWQSELTYYESYQLRAVNLLLQACYQAASPINLFNAELFLDQFHVSAKQQQMMIPQWTIFPGLVLLQPSGANSEPDDTVVIDRSTGLMWKRDLLGPVTWGDALNISGASITAPINGYYFWRLPTRAELASLGATQDHLTQAVGIRDVNIWWQYVWTADAYDDLDTLAETRGQYVVNLRDGGVAQAKFHIHTNLGDIDFNPTYQLLLVRDIVTPKSLPVSITAANVTGGVRLTATRSWGVSPANNPLGLALPYYQEDVTERAIWSVAVNGATDPGLVSGKVHISNAPDSSGFLQVRNVAPTDVVTVTAQVGDRTTSLTLNNLPPTDATVASLVISPGRTLVLAQGQPPITLTATSVTNSGVTSNVTNQVTWSSDNPGLVSVSSLGAVTLGTLPNTTTQVKITASYQGVAATAYVILP